jgi:hypothetical protein
MPFLTKIYPAGILAFMVAGLGRKNSPHFVSRAASEAALWGAVHADVERRMGMHPVRQVCQTAREVFQSDD